MEKLPRYLNHEDIANPNVTPESVVEILLKVIPCPIAVRKSKHADIYRVALHYVVQVLMLIAPIMAEWKKLNYSTTFELPRRVINKLNQISDQIYAFGSSGQTAADERYEISYRDYLLQRLFRVEAGTVRMTTNLAVDLRELFVKPDLGVESPSKKAVNAEKTKKEIPMDLAAARRFFERPVELEIPKSEFVRKSALDQVKKYPRNVIIGSPGSGKSTFLEWLQLQIAYVEEELEMNGRQAIPLLLRVRQLDIKKLPKGEGLVEKAMGSKDIASTMPNGWIDRQMRGGYVLFMLDGIDEIEPELCNTYLIPWFRKICKKYPKCRYLISSRPVGYTSNSLRDLEFVECNLLDFNEDQIKEYTRHWCVAVRLARNEPEREARHEGKKDGDKIVNGFKGHPYIRNLAQNPLMLSAICLVNYFEGGELPKDRGLLYKLCVEGLLHNWDQRRGIHSEFTFEEKLRTCREVALAMQADDRAEYEADKVLMIFSKVLDDNDRAANLLDHIRRRTGLLLERRPGIFAFAHLTFQEYLTAQAINAGNHRGIEIKKLLKEYKDERWIEVIPLYCSLIPLKAKRDLINKLIIQEDSKILSTVLTEAYFSAGPELEKDKIFRKKLIERIAVAPGRKNLQRFPQDEVAPIARVSIGKIKSKDLSEAYSLIARNEEYFDEEYFFKSFSGWRKMNPFQLTEFMWLLHCFASNDVLIKVASFLPLTVLIGGRCPPYELQKNGLEIRDAS